MVEATQWGSEKLKNVPIPKGDGDGKFCLAWKMFVLNTTGKFEPVTTIKNPILYTDITRASHAAHRLSKVSGLGIRAEVF